MDRNDEARYGEIAQIEKPRSTWNRDFNYKTTFNVGDIIPFYFDMDIIPGTTIKNTTSMVIRLNTPLNPTMDNMYVDTYWFKCSKFWYWEHWRRMMGENDYGAWAQTIEYTEPKIETDASVTAGDLANYLGVRQGVAGLEFSKIAVNCYIDIWNQWFRDQNLQAPYVFDKTDSDLSMDGSIYTGKGILKACKYHDYFSSLLPAPQKTSTTGGVTIPIGTSAPIVGPTDLRFTYTGDTATNGHLMFINQNGLPNNSTTINTTSSNKIVKIYDATNTLGETAVNLKYYSGLEVDLSNAVAATINAQRLAWATQRILERDAMAGTMYKDLLWAHYGSSPSDESVLRPEYLGGRREPINISQVVQNSSTDATSPLGYTGAVSLTAVHNEDFTKSFTKDDILVGLLVVRCQHSYAQGMPRQLTRTTRLDRYWPELAHIGNMPVYNYEIFAQGPSVVDSNGVAYDGQVFGYKEAWQEYMYKNDMVTGEFSPDYAQSLDSWIYVDDYSSLPVLSDNWIKEPVDYLDRTIAVQSSSHHQFFADIMVNQTVTAPIPLYRTPGLVDHF